MSEDTQEEAQAQEPDETEEAPPRRRSRRADPEAEPEGDVVFTPSQQMVEAVEAPPEHQIEGRPRVPTLEEGPQATARPIALEDAEAAQAEAATDAEIPRDINAYPGVAGIYVYEGEEPANYEGLGLVEPGDNDFRSILHPETLKRLEQLANDPTVPLRKK